MTADSASHASLGPAARTSSSAARRRRLLGAAAMLLFIAGLILAAVRPDWLTGPLEAAVGRAGPWGPVVFVLLTIILTPLHLNGVLVVLSPVIWPLPVAAGLSYLGSMVGCVLTWVLLQKVDAGLADQRDGWPRWLERMARHVSRRPYLVGFTVRFLLNSGLALEAFYNLTGYTRRQYLAVTAAGVAAWIAQSFLGVTALAAIINASPWIGVLAILLPVGTLAIVVVYQRRRGERGAREDKPNLSVTR